MAGASSDGEVNHWPAFVDVLTTVIMVVTFLLVIMSSAVMVLSQRAMGTRSIVLLHHTDCGLTKISEDTLRHDLEQATGLAPKFTFEAFRDPYASVRQSIRRLHLSPFLLCKDEILGYVYDVESGRLNQVRLED